MADAPKHRIEMTVEEWQELHSEKFENRIYGRLSGKANGFAKGFGVVNVIALAGIVWSIWVPFRTMVQAEAGRGANEIADKAATDMRTETKTTLDAARDEVNKRLTAAVIETVRQSVQEAATSSAITHIERQLADLNSGMRRQVLERMETQLVPLVRRTMVEQFATRFSSDPDTTQQSGAFEVLRRLDPDRARDELARMIQRRLLDGVHVPRRGDQVIARAILSLAIGTAEQIESGHAPLDFASSREFTLLITQLVERIWQPSQPISIELVAAAAAWLRVLTPDESVADWLYSRAVGQRSDGGHPAGWELLLQYGRPAAVARLGRLLREGSEREVVSAVRVLAARGWPAGLTPSAVADLFGILTAQVPGAVLGFAKITPVALEARWALLQAIPRGEAAARSAWARFGAQAKTAGIEEWVRPLEAYERSFGRPSTARSPNLEAPIVLLPLAQEAVSPWAQALAGLLRATADNPGAFVVLLIDDVGPEAAPELRQRRERRLATLAFAMSHQALDAAAVTPALVSRVLAQIASDPQLDSSRDLGIALQRLLPLADPAACEAAIKRRVGSGGWATAALLGCSAETGQARLDLLAEQLEPLNAGDKQRLLAYWLLTGSRSLLPPDSPPAGRQTTLSRGDQTVEALRLAGGSIAARGAVPFLAAMRRDGGAVDVDRALERATDLRLFPAPPGALPEALPKWAYPAWWNAGTGTILVTADGSPQAPRSVPSDAPLGIRIACSPDFSVRLRLHYNGARNDATGSILLLVPEGLPRRSEGPNAAVMAAEAACTGDQFALVSAPMGSTVVVEQTLAARAPTFATALDSLTAGQPLEPGRPVRIVLGERQEAFFPASFVAGHRYEIRTQNLQAGVDTTLVLLDARGRTVSEDDDSGEENLSSRIETEEDAPNVVVAIRAGTFGGHGGTFELLLQNLGVPAPPTQLALNVRRELRLPSNGLISMAVPLQADQNYRFATSVLGRRVDTIVTVFAPDGTELGSDDDSGGGRASRLALKATVNGLHRVMVRNIGTAGSFDLTVSTER